MRTLSACFHPCVFAAYPLLVVVGANAGVVPLDGAVIARCLAAAIGIAVILLLLLRPLVRDLATRAALLSFVFIGFSVYTFVAGASMSPGLASLYAVACVAASMLIVRPWTGRPRTSTGLTLAACVALVANLYSCAPALVRDGAWKAAADALVAEVVASAGRTPSTERPDIYHVVLDGFGRPDILRERFDLDLGPFVEALEARGFTVPPRGRSNYAQTYLSLGSALNLSYLDRVTSGMHDSSDRRALDYLIQHNAVWKLAKRAGYRVVAIGSDYAATEWIESADECRCERYGLHEMEATALSLTPLRALLPDRSTYGAHRRKIEAAFSHARAVAGDAGPTLVFAHVLAPHPPFVFHADGRPRDNRARLFTLTDGSQYGGSREEYVAGYREQAQFVANRVLAVVDAILARPGPSPVIVLHGDHGPGSTKDAEYVGGEAARERMGIFSAYRLPGDPPASLSPDVSPVNALRVMANRYLGATLPPLPDLSFASTWERPYEFVLIGADGGDERAAELRVRSTPKSH